MRRQMQLDRLSFLSHEVTNVTTVRLYLQGIRVGQHVDPQPALILGLVSANVAGERLQLRRHLMRQSVTFQVILPLCRETAEFAVVGRPL